MKIQHIHDPTIETCHSLDITNPQHIECRIDFQKKELHINVNGICVFHACQIETLEFNHDDVFGWDTR